MLIEFCDFVYERVSYVVEEFLINIYDKWIY